MKGTQLIPKEAEEERGTRNKQDQQGKRARWEM